MWLQSSLKWREYAKIFQLRRKGNGQAVSRNIRWLNLVLFSAGVSSVSTICIDADEEIEYHEELL